MRDFDYMLDFFKSIDERMNNTGLFSMKETMQTEEVVPKLKTMFSPSCHVKKEEDKYHIEVDVPGFSKEEIKVQEMNGSITVKAEKTEENATRKSIVQTFALSGCDFSKTKVTLKNGVLTLEVPFKEKQVIEPRTIDIE